MQTSGDDRFAAVPLDFVFALERGEITLDQWALGAFLVGRVDYRRNEVSYTLRSLADAVGWRKSPESLRLALGALRDAGWIQFDVCQGQRSPYNISLERLHRGRRMDEPVDATSKDEDPFA